MGGSVSGAAIYSLAYRLTIYNDCPLINIILWLGPHVSWIMTWKIMKQIIKQLWEKLIFCWRQVWSGFRGGAWVHWGAGHAQGGGDRGEREKRGIPFGFEKKWKNGNITNFVSRFSYDMRVKVLGSKYDGQLDRAKNEHYSKMPREPSANPPNESTWC